MHLVVVLDAHADAVKHDGDEDGALDVPAFDEALDVSAQLGPPTAACIRSRIPHHLLERRHCHRPRRRRHDVTVSQVVCY